MSGLDGKALVDWAQRFVHEKWAVAWNTHDGALLASFFHPRGVYWDPDFGHTPRDKIKAMIDTLDSKSPDHVFAVHPETVTVTRTGPNTFNACGRWTMLGQDGKLRLPGIDFLEFEDNQIVRATTYFCRMTAFAQTAGRVSKKGLPTDTDHAIAALKAEGKYQVAMLRAKY